MSVTTADAAVSLEVPVATQRERAARTTFRIALAYMTLMTLGWLFLLVSGLEGGRVFGDAAVTLELLIRLAMGFLFFWVGWSWAFYRLKRWLLRRVGLDDSALERVFSNRLEGFDLDSLIAPYSERKIRIIDMIGRRGRVAAAVFMGFYFVYRAVKQNPTPDALIFGLQSNLLEGLVFAWWGLITFHSNGILGRIAYGAHARIMDGVQGRANALCIGTLWHAFKFVMVPIGFGLAAAFEPEQYAAVFALIWFSYFSCDFASEIFGSLFGRQSIQVWGLGDVNRKSVAGTLSGLIAALVVGCLIVYANSLGPAWYALAAVVSVTTTLLELYSPRGTDDFTMATGNALVCWAFGVLALGG